VNTAIGDVIAVVMVLHLFLMTGLYILTPDPAGSPMVSLIISGSLGAVIVLTVALMGMVMRDAGLGAKEG
jgi:hypothetical protein